MEIVIRCRKVSQDVADCRKCRNVSSPSRRPLVDFTAKPRNEGTKTRTRAQKTGMGAHSPKPRVSVQIVSS